MLKILGAICLVFAGAVYGTSKSEALKINCAICREIRDLLTEISVYIRYRGLNVYEISRELNTSDRFQHLDFIGKLPTEYVPSEDFHALWNRAVDNDSCMGADEKALLRSFGAVLGTSDIDGQLLSVEGALEDLKKTEDKRSEEYRRKGKLYRSLGMLFGVMAGILFI